MTHPLPGYPTFKLEMPDEMWKFYQHIIDGFLTLKEVSVVQPIIQLNFVVSADKNAAQRRLLVTKGRNGASWLSTELRDIKDLYLTIDYAIQQITEHAHNLPEDETMSDDLFDKLIALFSFSERCASLKISVVRAIKNMI